MITDIQLNIFYYIISTIDKSLFINCNDFLIEPNEIVEYIKSVSINPLV